MSEQLTSSPEYWNRLRAAEIVLYDRNQATTSRSHPELDSVEVWSTGLFDPHGMDTMAYRAVNHLVFNRRISRLVMFDFMKINTVTDAKVFELDLKRGKESITVIPVYLRVSSTGMHYKTASWFKKQREAAIQLGKKVPGAIMANQADYELVDEQLARGASGAYLRYHPQSE